MNIKILGGGCANCVKLHDAAKQAADNLSIEVTMEKVTEMQDILSYGVMSTPALVVDGEVKLSGRVAAVSEIEKILQGA